MAKRRKKKRTSKCPEPINTLLDIAGGVTMGMIADHMENKYHYTKKGKINPYAVSALGIASGRLKTTEDLLRTGAILGALGSFDVDADDEPSTSGRKHVYVPENPVFREIRGTKSNDNRYAWRLNAQEGLTYGISPYDYETRSQYNSAVLKAKENKADNMQPDELITSQIDMEQSEVVQERICVKVSRLDDGSNRYYWAPENLTKIGDVVLVETEEGLAKGVVIAIHNTMDSVCPRYRVIDVLE